MDETIAAADDPLVDTLDSQVDLDRDEVVGEAVTVALYIALSLLAILAAIPSAQIEGDAELARTIGLTSLGLLMAHQVAYRMSSRLMNAGRLPALAPRLLAAQMSGGLVVTAVAVLPVLVIEGPVAVAWSIAMLLGLVVAVGYRTARRAGSGHLRALLYVGVVAAAVLVVLGVKGLVGH